MKRGERASARGMRACVRFATAWVALTLAACGGGGESPPASAPAPAPGLPVGGPTGLLPAAPRAGATLQADAATLRPLVPGARWTYQGSVAASVGGSTTSTYSNVVTQAADTQGVIESATNPGNEGASTQGVTISGGATHVPLTFDLDDTHSLPIDFVELRSQVRVNDQYASFDRRVDSLADVDADGKTDILDIVLYTQVVGEESLDLPHKPQVRAVHLRTTTLLRVQRSKTGTYGDTVTATADNWYAAGIGLVKAMTDVTPPGGARHVTTELLDTWSGLSVTPDAATQANGASLSPNGARRVVLAMPVAQALAAAR